MKPKTKRTAVSIRLSNNKDRRPSSPFNLTSLKLAIESIAKENTINLSASREVKQIEKPKRKRVRGKKKKNKNKKKKKKTKKKNKLIIGIKPEAKAELLRWLSNLDESFKPSLPKKLTTMQVAPKTLKKESKICGFNADLMII